MDPDRPCPTGEIVTRDIRVEVINRSSCLDISGVLQMSKDRAYLDLHDEPSSANSRPEYLVLRNPDCRRLRLMRLKWSWTVPVKAVGYSM